MVQIKGGTHNPWVSHHVEISLIDREALDWAHRVTGVGAIFTLAKPTNPNWSQAYRWVVYGRQSTRVLRETLPYLMIKARQAEIALEIAALRARYQRGKPHNVRRQIELAAELRASRRTTRAKLIDVDAYTFSPQVMLPRGANGQFTTTQQGKDDHEDSPANGL
jgi:hypothetical protein